MIRLSIKRKIIGIALILIVLMAVAALLSMALIVQVTGRLEDLTESYVPAYGSLARQSDRAARPLCGGPRGLPRRSLP